MNFTEIWTQISPMLQDLLVAVIGVVCAYAIKWLKAKSDSLKADTSNTIIKAAITNAEKVIEDCVKTTNQTYVDAIKGTDAWTKEAQEKAFELTKDAVLKILTSDTITIIKDSVGNFEDWLKTQIESTVSTNKGTVAKTA